MNNNLKVLFLCKKRHSQYGISVGLINSATFVKNTLNNRGIESKVEIVVDGNGIDRVVHHYRPSHVIIEALWVTPEKIQVLLRKYRSIKWVVRIHSKAAFIANEGIAFEWLTEYRKLIDKFPNLAISANNCEFNENLSNVLNIRSIYLPNIYNSQKTEVFAKKSDNSQVIDIGCFGAIRPLKNHLSQAIAAINFGNGVRKKIRFHVNSGRTEQHGENVLRNLRALFKYSKRHELVEHGWLNHSDFLRLVRQMDIGMQVSLSESYNIVAADCIVEGIPVVVSDEIGWVPWIFQADPNDCNHITSKINLVHRLPRWLVAFINRLALQLSNRKNAKEWLNYLLA